MTPRHPMHPDRKCNRGDGGQRLGHGGNRQRDAQFNDEPERRALPGAEGRNQRSDAERQPHETASQLVEPALERGASLLDRTDQCADAPNFRRRTGLSDNGDRCARRCCRALVDHVRAVCERRSFFEQLVGVLRDRKRLARQRGFVSPKVGAFRSSRASAGTRRPMSIWIMSPGTIVAASTLRSCPDRMTVAFATSN